MSPDAPRSAELFARAAGVIPGGVSSPVRAFGSVGGTPRFISSGSGAYLTDVDGERYLDYVCSWGPSIAGHAHPDVVAAARVALEAGASFGAPTAAEVELAEEVRAAYSAAEMVRLVNSGTEAGMTALRLARAATGRDKVVKFAGHYHGHADALLASAGSGVATLGLPDSPGVTAGATADTVVIGWNDRDALAEAFDSRRGEIAAVICEPVAANMGVVPPEEGFLARLREVTAEDGALLIFDEVLTGFRIARGGAAARYGIAPDLATFAKVIGGGFPLGAVGGRAEVMEQLAPSGPVYQSGTLSGNPVAVAAGLATLRLLDRDAYDHLERLADRLVSGLRQIFVSAGVPAVVQQAGSLLSVFFGHAEVRDYRDARAADHQAYAAFFNGMLSRGVYLPPSGYEALFVSLAHSDADIEATLVAAAEAAAVGALPDPG